jgi:hypothetical protein
VINPFPRGSSVVASGEIRCGRDVRIAQGTPGKVIAIGSGRMLYTVAFRPRGAPDVTVIIDHLEVRHLQAGS